MQTHHYRFLVASIVSTLIALVVAGGGFWAYEYFWARFQPIVLKKDESAIQRLLDEGDWVSPGRKGPALYLLTYRDCDACGVYQRQEFPKLAAVDVDTRVLVFVRPDVGGQSLSTAQERATVAELWINRDWGLYDRWMQTPTENWAPQGLRPADNDWGRTAVVQATHTYVDKLAALLKENGVTADDPIVIWRDKKGRLKACACTDRLSYHFVRSDFHAPDTAPPPAPAAPPASASPPAPSSSPSSSTPTAPTSPAVTGAPSAASVPAEAPPSGSAAPASGTAASTATKKPPARSEDAAKTVFY
jgi:hypothetical protein